MNKQRRKNLDKIVNDIVKLKEHLAEMDNKDAQKMLDKIIYDIELVRDEEQDSFDNMPENLQGSLRGMASEEAIDNMEEALNYLEETKDLLKEKRDDPEKIEECLDMAEDYLFDASC